MKTKSHTLTMLLISMASILLFVGCSQRYLQVCAVESVNTPSKQGKFTFENDSIRVKYDFWGENGVMSYEINNKMDKPIYIDWKKSSYIVNTVKLDYWQEEERVITSSVYQQYLNKNNTNPVGYGVSVSQGKVIKEERVTFIPPKSNYYRTQFRISTQQLDFSKDTISYDSLSTPLNFRNFLTYSTNEHFEKESYINSDFYIGKVYNKMISPEPKATAYYQYYKARYKNLPSIREDKSVVYNHHIFSLLADIEGYIGGGLGFSYEFIPKNQNVGIHTGHSFNFGRYLGSLDFKAYLAKKNEGKPVRVYVGPSIILGSAERKKLLSVCGNFGLNFSFARHLTLNFCLVRVGYGVLRENIVNPTQNIDYWKDSYKVTAGTYFSIGYGF